MASAQARALANPPRGVQDGETVTPEEGLANVLAAFPVTWSREFATHTTEDGGTIYVDTATGLTYDTMPGLHSKDGTDL